MLLALPLGLAIGLVIGAVGGGGAILALPVLVYGLGESVGAASTASLVVVALAAAAGGATSVRQGQVCWRVALGLAGPAAVGALIGAVANRAADGRLLLLAFVPVMLAAAWATWRRTRAPGAVAARGCPTAPLARVALAGLGVGLLTGFFGVGGGFIVVPVLTLWLGMDLRRAIASSLVVVALTAAAAFGSHLLAGATLHVEVAAALGAAAVAGAIAGARIGRTRTSAELGRAFALLVAAVAVFLLADVTLLGGPPSA
jgi:uncharacterized membrane protein YfcA